MAEHTMKLKIQGRGGHGSSPHLANDAIVAGAHFVTAVQTIISRRLSPFDIGVITIGSFDGKGTFNVIKDSVELEGDIRYMTVETKEMIEREVRRIVKGLEEEFGVTCELTYTPDYPPLYNNPELVAEIVETLQNANEKEITEVEEFPMSLVLKILLTMQKNSRSILLYWVYTKRRRKTIFQPPSKI